MGDKISFQFMTLKAEAEGIRAVRIIARLTLAGLLASVVVSAIVAFSI